MTLSEQDRGRTVEVNLGSIITLRLNESPATGYRWAVRDAHGLEQIGDHFEPGGSAIGAAGVRVFEFRTPRVGSYELRLEQRREWEGESSVIDRFDAKIIVR